MYDIINLNIDTRSRFINILNTYEDAISSSNSRKWKDAMDEELKSLNENDTFTLTPLPSGKNVIEGRWVYTIKEGQKGNLIYKARYVAKGYSQTKDVDYFETYSPTTKMTSVRMLMQLAAQNDYIVE